jgi:hypothetical protein
MDCGQFSQIAQTRVGSVSRRTVLAALASASLLLAARSATLAAGKLGGASGIDRSAYATSVEAADGKVGGSMDRLARLGGKLGIGAGDD